MEVTILGQKNLLKRIESMIDTYTLPRFIIIVGDRGSQSQLVAPFIAEKMNATYVQALDVKVDTIRNIIRDAYKSHRNTVFNITNADAMSGIAKNSMLKVTEEPPNRAYFVLCLEDLQNTLPTITSRGSVFYMDKYSRDDLEKYFNTTSIEPKYKELVLSIAETPGEIDMFSRIDDIDKFYTFIKDAVRNIPKTTGALAFTYAKSLALKNEEDKYDVALFLKAYQVVSLQMLTDMTESTASKMIKSISVTGRILSELRIRGINKYMLIDNWILAVRAVWM